jgi:hypothetical protein
MSKLQVGSCICMLKCISIKALDFSNCVMTLLELTTFAGVMLGEL